MNPQIMPNYRKESLQEDGMLFVRSESILKSMIKAPIALASLIIVIIAMPIQTSFSSTRSLELIVYPDGSTHVSTIIDIDPLQPDFELHLYGESIDNFVAVGDSGFLLSQEIIGDRAIIETFGSTSITVEYDIHDLISKEGRVWTFALNSTSGYSLVMPKNSVIVGMSVLPHNMELIDDTTQLDLSNGTSEINYIFGVPINPIDPNQPKTPTETSFNYLILLIGAPIIGAIIAVLLIIKRKQSKNLTPSITDSTLEKQPQEHYLKTETIFNLRPEMREDDKEIIKFISKNGGQALESELRKKFLQPRTTMWRAVKRLERMGIIEIDKKDLQNLVKLKKNLEREE